MWVWHRFFHVKILVFFRGKFAGKAYRNTTKTNEFDYYNSPNNVWNIDTLNRFLLLFHLRFLNCFFKLIVSLCFIWVNVIGSGYYFLLIFVYYSVLSFCVRALFPLLTREIFSRRFTRRTTRRHCAFSFLNSSGHWRVFHIMERRKVKLRVIVHYYKMQHWRCTCDVRL